MLIGKAGKLYLELYRGHYIFYVFIMINLNCEKLQIYLPNRSAVGLNVTSPSVESVTPRFRVTVGVVMAL